MKPGDLDYSLHYREWHDDSDAHLEQMRALLTRQFAPYLPTPQHRPALDIGCGMGFMIATLEGAGFDPVKGVDMDASQVAACQARGFDVEQITDLIAYLNARPLEFGLVTMIDVLEHIPVTAQAEVLRAIYGSMALGGRLIIQVPNASSILATRWLYQDFTHVSSFTERSIRFVLRNASFSRIDVPPLENPPARPSLRPRTLFTQQGRWYFRRWFVRWIWRQVLQAELYTDEDISRIPLSLNLLAIADKV